MRSGSGNKNPQSLERQKRIVVEEPEEKRPTSFRSFCIPSCLRVGIWRAAVAHHVFIFMHDRTSYRVNFSPFRVISRLYQSRSVDSTPQRPVAVVDC